jgi:hypothetical protein
VKSFVAQRAPRNDGEKSFRAARKFGTGNTEDSLSPFSRRGRRKESQGGGENEKAFLFLKTESEGFAVFPATLSVEELG